MKVKVLAPCMVTIAFILMLGVLAMISNLTLEHLIPSCIQNDTWYTGLVVSLSPGGQHAATRSSAG